MLNSVKSTLLMLTFVLLPSGFASAQTSPDIVRQQISLKGTVETIDHTARTVTIRGDQGNIVTLDIPASVKRLDQVKVGDVVHVSYYDIVSLRLKPAGEAAVDRTLPPVTATSAAGALPGATTVSQRVTTVTITGWDPATKVVTFTGPRGVAYSRHLLDTTDPTVLAGIKVGDRVDVTRTEAAGMEIQAPTTTQVQVTEGFRNRLTMAVLWGWENNFSGNMIQAADGLTTTGIPLHTTETSFDDVYGRMTGFKVGFGYRTTPRSEVVFNFTIARNSAERVSVGTAGVNNVPLYVDFDSYNNWGIEAGQRWFFARTRFTPFVGYLVGINRYDDIRGTFVDVPLDLTPGLAAQDGKFFEKSWAFNFGPTGGFLIGLGPLELMAEAQLRYMGGLSDVDWLIEEGLRDINDDSKRWSLPVQLGLRFRF